MKKIIAFSSEEDIFKILGWDYTGDYSKDCEKRDSLWDAGFNLDDWDQGFCCDEPLHRHHVEDDGYEFDCFTDDVYWLGTQMENYCVGFHYCEAFGKHWYTVHHS